MSGKILVVDDSFEFNFLLSSLFKFNNLEVVTETNPLEAIEKVPSGNFKVVIVDYMMNEMDCITFAKKVQETSSEIRIILLTAKNLDTDELSEIHDLGIMYIKKPIMPNELLNRVIEIVEN